MADVTAFATNSDFQATGAPDPSTRGGFSMIPSFRLMINDDRKGRVTDTQITSISKPCKRNVSRMFSPIRARSRSLIASAAFGGAHGPIDDL